MAASSLISPALNPRKATGATAAPTENAPAVALPMAFIVTGLAALFVAAGWIMAQPVLLAGYHYSPAVVAAVHLIVLGWIVSVVMGAMYQLVPVALETRLYSEKLARWHFALHAIGFVGMVLMFREWNMKLVGHFASALALGVGLFVYNVARTLRRVPRWNVTATAVSAVLAWFTLTILAGLSLATAKCGFESAPGSSIAGPLFGGLQTVAAVVGRFDPISAMHAHAHLGVIGCFLMLIVGVSYKLVPMFTLSEVQNPRRAGLSIALLNVGLVGLFFTILLRNSWKLGFALVVTAALGIYLRELNAILRARKRRSLDWGIKYFLTAVGFMAPCAALGVALSWPGLPLTPLTGQLENLYGFLGLIGVVTLAIIGMLYKIIPFLVWFGRYSRQIGRAQVPALADLYSAAFQAVGYWTFLAGLGVTSVGILLASELVVRVGSAFLAASLVTLAVNVGLMLSHLVKPRVKPLTVVAAAPKPYPA